MNTIKNDTSFTSSIIRLTDILNTLDGINISADTDSKRFIAQYAHSLFLAQFHAVTNIWEYNDSDAINYVFEQKSNVDVDTKSDVESKLSTQRSFSLGNKMLLFANAMVWKYYALSWLSVPTIPFFAW